MGRKGFEKYLATRPGEHRLLTPSKIQFRRQGSPEGESFGGEDEEERYEVTRQPFRLVESAVEAGDGDGDGGGIFLK